MKKLLGLAVVVLIVVGVVKLVSGRSDEAKATMVCEQIIELCGSAMRREGIDISKSDIDECAADVAKEAPRDLGSSYEPFVDCVEDADTCGEIVGCGAGAFLGELDGELHGFGRGLGRMMDK